MNDIEKQYVAFARELAHIAHRKQTRHDGVTPYIVHPMRVADKVRHLGAYYEATAWLHDAVEDGGCTMADMYEKVPAKVYDAVKLLTKTPGVSDYLDYIRLVSADNVARAVKIADIRDNISDRPSAKQLRKYADALLILLAYPAQP